jgi:hypothetical protein
LIKVCNINTTPINERQIPIDRIISQYVTNYITTTANNYETIFLSFINECQINITDISALIVPDTIQRSIFQSIKNMKYKNIKYYKATASQVVVGGCALVAAELTSSKLYQRMEVCVYI